MPVLFQSVLIAGMVCYLLIALLFYLTRDMPRLNPGITAWLWSSLAGAIGYCSLLIVGTISGLEQGVALYNVAALFWASLLYVGTSQWIGLPVPRRMLFTFGGLTLASLLYNYYISPNAFLASLSIALYAGGLNLTLAWKFAKYKPRKCLQGWGLVGLLAVSGLHWLDYPLLRTHETFAPIGFLLCATLSVLINAAFTSMVIRQFKTRMMRSTQRAIDKATHDPLTGLHNRLGLETATQDLIEISQLRNQQFALIFIDLDKFKPVNDTYGHAAGDQLLIAVAHRIQAIARAHDIVARLGGDEFVVVLTELDDNIDEHLALFIQRALKKIREPVAIDGHRLEVDMSLGTACFPKHGNTWEALLEQADQYMYIDKEMKHRGTLQRQSIALPRTSSPAENRLQTSAPTNA